jgi:cellulose synthase/poly-beta-1,6-N-acetylglucosamine synthase-like glycosyltransferase
MQNLADRVSFFWLLFAAADLLAAIGMGILLTWTDLKMRLLKRTPPGPREHWPRVSIIVAARNEERNVEAGARSLLGLDYPDLQITVVNDRSTDQTGAILMRIATEDPRLNVVHVTDLPAGWLGKNHAMQRGADGSNGDWLLFTDADVVFEPTALRRGIVYAEEHRLDHLAVTPMVDSPSLWLRAFIPVFSMCFVVYLKAWWVRNPRSSAHAGIGAFNLVRKSAYEAVGGHSRLPLRPDDDIKLGKILKEAGFRQDLAVGRGLLWVEWYRTFWELVRGLEKNAFAGVDYKPWMTLGAAVLMILVFLVPFAAPFFTSWPANAMFAAAAGIFVAFAVRACLQNAQPPWLGLLFPIGIIAFMLIQLRTMVLNLAQGGIYWRDTFYSLEELRRNRV